MSPVQSASPVLAYARKPRRRWRRWKVLSILLALLAVVKVAVIYETELRQCCSARAAIFTEYWCERPCLQFDSTSLPTVVVSAMPTPRPTFRPSPPNKKLGPLNSFCDAQARGEYQRTGNRGLLTSLPIRFGSFGDEGILLHQTLRPDKTPRLVYVFVIDGVLEAMEWTVATPLDPATKLDGMQRYFECPMIDMPPGRTLSLHVIVDPSDENHLQIRADVSGSPAVGGTIDVSVKNDDSIVFQLPFGSVERDRHGCTHWNPLGTNNRLGW